MVTAGCKCGRQVSVPEDESQRGLRTLEGSTSKSGWYRRLAALSGLKEHLLFAIELHCERPQGSKESSRLLSKAARARRRVTVTDLDMLKGLSRLSQSVTSQSQATEEATLLILHLAASGPPILATTSQGETFS